MYRVSNTYPTRIRRGYAADTYPRRIRELGRIGPENLRLDTYLIGYGPVTAHLKEHTAPVALTQLPHAQPLRSSRSPARDSRRHSWPAPAGAASALAGDDEPRPQPAGTPGPGAPRAATTSRNRGCTAAGTREPPPAWLLQRTSARLKVQRSSSPVLVLSLPLFLFPTNLPD